MLPTKKGLEFFLALDQRKRVRNALRETKSVPGAAKLLGIHVRTLQLRCERDPSLTEGIELIKRGRPPKRAGGCYFTEVEKV